jgi:hypothetical protein
VPPPRSSKRGISNGPKVLAFVSEFVHCVLDELEKEIQPLEQIDTLVYVVPQKLKLKFRGIDVTVTSSPNMLTVVPPLMGV